MGDRTGRAPRVAVAAITGLAAFSLLAAMAPARVEAAGSTPLAVRAWHGNNCVGGFAPKGKTAIVRWRSSSGKLKAKGKAKVNKRGTWSLCSKSGGTVKSGDRIKARVGVKVREAKVARLSMTIDREEDSVVGKAPAGRTLILQIWCANKQGITKWCGYEALKVKADGTFALDVDNASSTMSISGLTGGDRVEVFLLRQKPKHNVFGRDQYTPYVGVELGSATVTGAATPGSSVTVKTWYGSSPKASWTGSASGTTKIKSDVYEGKIRVTGRYGGTLRNGGSAAVPVSSGDRIDVPGITWGSGWSALAINVDVDKGADVVSGSCGSERRLEVKATSKDGSKTGRKTGLTNSNGTYSRNFHGQVDIAAGSVVKVTCFESSGDRTTQRVVVK